MTVYRGFRDEWYPVFGLLDPSLDPVWTDFTVELSDKDHADYQRVCDEFDAWQKRLGLAFVASKETSAT